LEAQRSVAGVSSSSQEEAWSPLRVPLSAAALSSQVLSSSEALSSSQALWSSQVMSSL
jgi:hypothetical protein